jgi:hypothetical protein
MLDIGRRKRGERKRSLLMFHYMVVATEERRKQRKEKPSKTWKNFLFFFPLLWIKLIHT